MLITSSPRNLQLFHMMIWQCARVNPAPLSLDVCFTSQEFAGVGRQRFYCICVLHVPQSTGQCASVDVCVGFVKA